MKKQTNKQTNKIWQNDAVLLSSMATVLAIALVILAGVVLIKVI